MAEWVLHRREQQLVVGEDVLLLTAKAALGEGVEEEERCSWTIDFMLRHDLGLQTTNNNKLKSIQDNSRTFIHSLYARVSCWHVKYKLNQDVCLDPVTSCMFV